MASLRKFKESPYWFAVYRDASGKQCNRSTKVRIAGQGASEQARGRDAAQNRKNAQTVAAAYEQAERGHPTELQVQRVLLDIFAKVNKRRLAPAIAETFVKAWLGKVRTRRGEGGTLERYEAVADRFLDSLGTRRGAQLNDITTADVQAFVDLQAKAGKAPATVRIEHKIINSIFADALKQGMAATNPAAGVAVPLDAGETRRPFDWSQVRDLLGAADGEWKTLIMLGAFTGARLGDCCAMCWDHLDFSGRLIRFRPAKTKAKGGELVVPMHPDLEAHLLTLAAPDGPAAGTQPLCPKLAAEGIGGRSGLSRKFQELIGKAGIENAQKRHGKGKGRSMSAYSFHSLRHAFNSALMNNGVGEDLRMRLSGHASEEMNRRYSHAEVETLRSAVAKLPGVRA